jgi:hypothetical protein
MSAIARMAKERGALFVVAVTPIRQIAEETLNPAAINAMWDKLETVIKRYGGHFTRRRGEQLDDSLFTDFAHLNACGAERWTKALVTEFEPMISKILTPTDSEVKRGFDGGPN